MAALVADFDIEPSDIPEPFTGDPVRDAQSLAIAKARAVADVDERVYIGSDTVVYDGQRSFGKPVDHSDAVAMLSSLAGREHRVATGVAVIVDGRVSSEVSISTVELSVLTADAIEAYVASGRPMDKAGAYAIQDEDVPTVARFEGCYCGVMGLPLWRLRALLVDAGVACSEPSARFERCGSCPERSPVTPPSA